MTAHPKIDPATGEMVFFGYSPFPPYVRLYEADATGTITWTTDVDLPGPVMMHDFVVTATRVVLFDLPAVFDVEAMLEGRPGFYWAPEHGRPHRRGGPRRPGRHGEVDRGRSVLAVPLPQRPRRRRRPSSRCTACRAPRLNTTFGDQTLEEPSRPSLHRWRIDLATGTVTDEALDDRPGDFPRVDDRRAGLAARYGYLAQAGEWTSDRVDFGSVRKYDLTDGTSEVASYGPSTTSGEPVFAANPDDPAEDAGWIVNLCHDWDADESSVRILDAETLEEAARVHLPRRVPFGFHGSFIPKG